MTTAIDKYALSLHGYVDSDDSSDSGKSSFDELYAKNKPTPKIHQPFAIPTDPPSNKRNFQNSSYKVAPKIIDAPPPTNGFGSPKKKPALPVTNGLPILQISNSIVLRPPHGEPRKPRKKRIPPPVVTHQSPNVQPKAPNAPDQITSSKVIRSRTRSIQKKKERSQAPSALDGGATLQSTTHMRRNTRDEVNTISGSVVNNQPARSSGNSTYSSIQAHEDTTYLNSPNSDSEQNGCTRFCTCFCEIFRC